MHVTCQACGAELQVRDQLAERVSEIACVQCGSRVSLGVSAVPISAAAAPSQSIPPSVPLATPRPASRTGLVVAVVAASTISLAVVAAVGTWLLTPKHEEEKVLPSTQDEILAATIAEEKREVTELQSQLDRVQATLKQSQSEELAQLEEIRQAENSLRPARERFGQLTSSPWLNDLKASADGAAR